MNETNIDIKKKYQTKDGREVRIYNNDGAGIMNNHGAVLNDGGWLQACWDNKGLQLGTDCMNLVEATHPSGVPLCLPDAPQYDGYDMVPLGWDTSPEEGSLYDCCHLHEKGKWNRELDKNPAPRKSLFAKNAQVTKFFVNYIKEEPVTSKGIPTKFPPPPMIEGYSWEVRGWNYIPKKGDMWAACNISDDNEYMWSPTAFILIPDDGEARWPDGRFYIVYTKDKELKTTDQIPSHIPTPPPLKEHTMKYRGMEWTPRRKCLYKTFGKIGGWSETFLRGYPVGYDSLHYVEYIPISPMTDAQKLRAARETLKRMKEGLKDVSTSTEHLLEDLQVGIDISG